MFYNQKVGQYGEQIAKDFLIKNGYKIIESNIKASYKEIDLIAKKEGVLIFVEVKTRTTDAFGEAESAIGHGKIRHLKKAMAIYLDKFNQEKFDDLRLDFIAIDINKDTKKACIKHFKDII